MGLLYRYLYPESQRRKLAVQIIGKYPLTRKSLLCELDLGPVNGIRH